MTHGDKQMLIRLLREGYHEMMAPFAQNRPVSTLEIQRQAANASTFIRSDVKAKRHGRLRRMNRSLSHNASGWKVRTW